MIQFYLCAAQQAAACPTLFRPLFFVRAGFPSPAQDYLDLRIDLNQELIRNAEATFFGR